MVLVYISLQLYNDSGAAQLDLSRPGYQSIRDQVDHSDDDLPNYNSSGSINATTINQFETLYDQQTVKIKTSHIPSCININH